MKAMLSKLLKYKEKSQESKSQQEEPGFKRQFSGYEDVSPKEVQEKISKQYEELQSIALNNTSSSATGPVQTMNTTEKENCEFTRHFSGVYREIAPSIAQREIDNYYKSLGNQQRSHPVSTSKSVSAVNQPTTAFRKLNP